MDNGPQGSRLEISKCSTFPHPTWFEYFITAVGRKPRQSHLLERKQGTQCRQLSTRPRLSDSGSVHPTLCWLRVNPGQSLPLFPSPPLIITGNFSLEDSKETRIAWTNWCYLSLEDHRNGASRKTRIPTPYRADLWANTWTEHGGIFLNKESLKLAVHTHKCLLVNGLCRAEDCCFSVLFKWLLLSRDTSVGIANRTHQARPRKAKKWLPLPFNPEERRRAWLGMEERGVQHQVCCKHVSWPSSGAGLGRASVLVRAIRFAVNNENQTTRGEDCCWLQKLPPVLHVTLLVSGLPLGVMTMWQAFCVPVQ